MRVARVCERARSGTCRRNRDRGPRLLQLVVIDLTVDENAQEIFETLNARGAQLTAADLIKNLVFQRVAGTGRGRRKGRRAGICATSKTAFWETETSVGRVKYARSALFLNHWLIARTGEEIVAREVFDRFKRYANDDSVEPVTQLLADIHAESLPYRRFVEAANTKAGPIDRSGLFGYRTGVLESEVIKPLVIWLTYPDGSSIPDQQFRKALDVTESWMVRRMLVRATTKSYTQIVAEIITRLRNGDRLAAGDLLEGYFESKRVSAATGPTMMSYETSCATSWRTDVWDGADCEWCSKRLKIPDLRGWVGDREGLGGERVGRGTLPIEHIMPRKWGTHWPLPIDGSEADRDKLVHTLGNLTLLTKKLNSKVSNGPWLTSDGEGKKTALQQHDVFFLNRDLLAAAKDDWTDAKIHVRTAQLTEILLRSGRCLRGISANMRKRASAAVRRFNSLICRGERRPRGSIPVPTKEAIYRQDSHCAS